MADSGLLLNFAAGDLPVSRSTPKLKGGAWRERAKLKRATKGPLERATDTTDSPNRIPLSGRQPQERSNKRRKLSDDAEKPQQQPYRHLGREVISSLFTYNPAPQTATEEVKPDKETAEAVKPSNAPLPDGIHTFTTLGLSDTVAAHLLTKMGLENPTAIQKAAVSQLTKEDGDVFIQSETGSGKTLAYLLPIVQRIVTMAERQEHESEVEKLHRDSGLFAIVLAPTRELCKQISVVLEKLLGCAHYVVAGTVIGGEKKKSEKARLRKGLNILVATPGRLVDHLQNTQTLDVSKVRYLVLDEGDRLMDLGFEDDITKIVKHLDDKKAESTQPGLPTTRINVLCSATLRANVEKLGNISLKDATLVKGSSDVQDHSDNNDSPFLAPAQLKQSYVITAAKLRFVTLVALLRRTFARKGSVMKAIVFLSCADSVDFHHSVLINPTLAAADTTDASSSALNPDASNTPLAPSPHTSAPSPLLCSTQNPQVDCYRLHGSLPQPTRTSILQSFTRSTTPSVLLATDVASRGLDLPSLDLVIEYDPAFSKEDHLHRIGRTARLGRDGRAIIFLMPGSEEGYIQVLRDSYKSSADGAGTSVAGTTAEDVLRKGFTPSTGVVGNKADWETRATDLQLRVERLILADAALKDLARKAYQSHIRAYSTHIAAERVYFDLKALHLGHLAKGFGLRDAPGKVNVVGLRGVGKADRLNSKRPQKERGEEEAEERKPRKTLAQKTERAEIDAVDDAESAAAKMRSMVRKRGGMLSGMAEEFNIA